MLISYELNIYSGFRFYSFKWCTFQLVWWCIFQLVYTDNSRTFEILGRIGGNNLFNRRVCNKWAYGKEYPYGTSIQGKFPFACRN